MKPYIFGTRNLIHIIDIRETMKGLLRAKKFLGQVAARGQDVLFVGTKRQARGCVMDAARKTDMHFVTERWLGGTLTNFRTIRSRLARLEELEAVEAAGMESQYSKKMIARLNRERRKLKRNLEGIRNMNKLPGALVLVDVKREHIAAREARKLKIPVVGLIDTDSDPDDVDIPIPGNDDAMRAIDLVVTSLTKAVEEGKRARPAEAGAEGEGGPQAGRRSSRVTARSAGTPASETGEGQDAASEATPPSDSAVAPT